MWIWYENWSIGPYRCCTQIIVESKNQGRRMHEAWDVGHIVECVMCQLIRGEEIATTQHHKATDWNHCVAQIFLQGWLVVLMEPPCLFSICPTLVCPLHMHLRYPQLLFIEQPHINICFVIYYKRNGINHITVIRKLAK